MSEHDGDEWDAGPTPEQERRAQVRSALIKAAAVFVGLALVVLIGTKLMVSGLNLDATETASKQPSAQVPAPLPTTALPTPSKESSPTAEPSPSESPSATPSPGGLRLVITPVMARPLDRLDLSGTYPGEDAGSLQVQRWDNGGWTDFPVKANVNGGSFTTYILTGRLGDNKFRVYDPATEKASNPVTVTIG